MTECGARAFIWTGIASILFLGVFNRIGLYADGAEYLYEVLTTGTVYTVDQSRRFSDVLTQAPLVAAISLGFRNLGWITFIHSAGLVFVPSAIWLLALHISRNERGFWLFVTAFCVTWLLAGFMAIEEYNVAHALAALCLSILLKETWRAWHPVALVTAALALTHTYESNLFISPLLFAVALHRLLQNDGKSRTETGMLAAAIALFGYAFVVSVVGVIWSQHPVNRATAADIKAFINPKVILCFVLCALFVRTHSSRRPAPTWPFRLAIVLTICEIVFSALWSNGPFSYYAVRSVAAVLLLIVLVSATLISLDFVAVRKFSDPAKLSPYVTLLFFGLAIPFALNEIEFGGWIRAFQREANAIQTNTPIDKTDFYRAAAMQKYSWSWTNPQLSLLLRRDGSAMILNCTCYSGYQSFDPAKLTIDPLAKYR